MTSAFRWLAVIALSMAGCRAESSSSEQPVDAGNGSRDAGLDAGGEPPDTDDGGEADWYGTLTVSLRESIGETMAYGLLSGTLYDGPIPDPAPLRIVKRAGDCALRELALPFCEGGCGSDAACVADDRCVPYPRARTAGELEVRGLAEPVTLEPVPPSFFYQSEKLTYPPCSEGAMLRLTGDNFAAEVRCVAPLIVDRNQTVRVRRGEPVTLTWDPPGDPELARIRILLDVSHHGGKRGDVWCEVADTGHYQIPTSLITPLVDWGLAGYPSVILARFTEAAATRASLTFTVTAQVERAVDTGVRSCLSDTGPEGCPEGQSCDRALLICRE